MLSVLISLLALGQTVAVEAALQSLSCGGLLLGEHLLKGLT